MTISNEEIYYTKCRVKASDYLATALAKSTVNKEIKKTVGRTMIMLYGKIYHDEDILKDSEIFCELDSNFLYAMDLIKAYILDIPCMQKDDDAINYINTIRDENIRRLVLNLYETYENELK